MFSGINGTAYMARGTADPTVDAGVRALVASLYLRDDGGVGSLFLKTGPADTEWTLVTLLLQASDPTVLDASSTPGDVVAAAHVRKLKVKVAVGNTEQLITHPLITAASIVVGSSEGNATLSPEASRRWNVRPVAGGIVFGISAAATADDGAINITIEAT
jgi:hypothetical protein